MKRNSIVIALLIHFGDVFSQDTSSTAAAKFFTVSGSADVYYRYSLNNPPSIPYNNLTSFTRSHNSFELGMASVKAAHHLGKTNAVIDLGFGKRAEEFAYNDSNTRLALKQLYFTYTPIEQIQLTAGTWSTHIGYEMPDPSLNRNYSMSYLFTNGPFTHTGLKADIRVGGNNTLMIGISNPVDYRTAPALPKSLIGQFATGSNDGRLKAYFNILAGRQNNYKKMIQGDVVLSYAASDLVSMAVNGTLQSVKTDLDSTGKFNSSQWGGVAAYVNIDPVHWLGLTLRTEYVSDGDNYLGLGRVFASTISANMSVDDLMIIPEFRLDHSRNRIFYDKEGQVRSAANFLLAAVYHF